MTKLTNLHFFWYSIFWRQEPRVYWETSRSDTDHSRILETDKIIISWHWGELCLQMVLLFCPFYLNLPTQMWVFHVFMQWILNFKKFGAYTDSKHICTVKLSVKISFALLRHRKVLNLSVRAIWMFNNRVCEHSIRFSKRMWVFYNGSSQL